YGQLRRARLLVDLQRDVPVLAQLRQLDARPALEFRRLWRLGRQLARALRDGVGELAPRHHSVDQAPLDGALALHALSESGKSVGEIATHHALVDHAREPAGAGG